MPEQARETTSHQAKRVADDERAIQRRIDGEEKSFKKQEPEQPPQTGARPYPYPPFPEQHEVKPGIEAKLAPAPM
jgi:hypothetical protein